MAQQTIDLHVNPSEETIRLGPLAVHFLITAENSNGSLAAWRPLRSLSRAGNVWRRRRIATTITKRRSIGSTEC
jgi:hypothetical protein